ncbi:MAG: hypothetical protein U0790_23640 [Isosphaeraceae bacterium]
MSSQAEVHSVEAIKDLRTALALYAEDAQGALDAVEAEIRRTVQWLTQDRPYYWQEQIKRRREQVASARAEVFRRKLQKTPEYHPSLSEPMEILRRAEASLQDAEKRLAMVRKWQPLLQQAILEYHGSARRIKDLVAADVPRAIAVLTRIVDALEAYLRLAPPPGAPAAAVRLDAIAAEELDREPPAPSRLVSHAADDSTPPDLDAAQPDEPSGP